MGKMFGMAFAVAAMSCSAATLTPENAEIVVEKGAPDVVKVAGRELSTFLSRSFGREVPVSETPTSGRVSVVLGERALSRAEIQGAKLSPARGESMAFNCRRRFLR